MVVDIFFSGVGQDASGVMLLFLMEDGTVQYLPLKKTYATDYENLKSYGVLSGISNIIKFYSANSLSQLGGVLLYWRRVKIEKFMIYQRY